MSELVKRLRAKGSGDWPMWVPLADEAADRIEEQERLLDIYRGQNDIKAAQAARIAALETALRTAKMMCRVGMPEYQAEDVVEIIDEALAQTKTPDPA